MSFWHTNVVQFHVLHDTYCSTIYHIIHKCTNGGQDSCHSLLCYHHQWILKQTCFLCCSSSSSSMTRTRCCWFIPFSMGFLFGHTRCKQCIYNTKNTRYSETIISQCKFWEDDRTRTQNSVIRTSTGKIMQEE